MGLLQIIQVREKWQSLGKHAERLSKTFYIGGNLCLVTL